MIMKISINLCCFHSEFYWQLNFLDHDSNIVLSGQNCSLHYIILSWLMRHSVLRNNVYNYTLSVLNVFKLCEIVTVHSKHLQFWLKLSFQLSLLQYFLNLSTSLEKYYSDLSWIIVHNLKKVAVACMRQEKRITNVNEDKSENRDFSFADSVIFWFFSFVRVYILQTWSFSLMMRIDLLRIVILCRSCSLTFFRCAKCWCQRW